jgi:sugar lactone lactonase YvrE
MPRVADGIALDSAGAIWIANSLAPECARIAPGGAVIETVTTSQNCYACMLGGDDGKTLFMMTAPTSLPYYFEKTLVDVIGLGERCSGPPYVQFFEAECRVRCSGEARFI